MINMAMNITDMMAIWHMIKVLDGTLVPIVPGKHIIYTYKALAQKKIGSILQGKGEKLLPLQRFGNL